MAPFHFQSVQSLEISTEDNPTIDFRDDQTVITAERGGEKILITVQIPALARKVAKTTVKSPGRKTRASHPMKGRTLPATDPRTGSNNRLAKLTEDSVREIRTLYKDADMLKSFESEYKFCLELAKVYKVHHTTVHNIIHYHSWKHV